ncbi:MAG: D-alanine--D-alanine ligase [Planctomycetaceae bacterium]
MEHQTFGFHGPYRVAVLAGGLSAEREISLKSGASVVRALTVRGHRAQLVDPRDVDLTQFPWQTVDIAFLALHGTFGEDGHVQRQLAELGVRFTGSDADASQLAMSKSAAKERFHQYHVPTPTSVLVHQADDFEHVRRLAERIGYPLFVKPDAQGSSLGVTQVRSPDQLAAALALCFQFDTFALLEAAIQGTEWTVGMLDREPLPLIEIRTPREFFDYHAKYEDDATEYLFEFSIPTSVVQAINKAAVTACEAISTSGLVRVDLRLDRRNDPWVLEINTIPGLTDHSLIPKAAARVGMSLGQLCERTIILALSAATQSATPHAVMPPK